MSSHPSDGLSAHHQRETSAKIKRILETCKYYRHKFEKNCFHKACGNKNVPEIDAFATHYYNEKGTQQGLSLWKYGVTLHQIILLARNNMNSLFPS